MISTALLSKIRFWQRKLNLFMDIRVQLYSLVLYVCPTHLVCGSLICQPIFLRGHVTEFLQYHIVALGQLKWKI